MQESLERILLVEDEEDIREITRHLLEALGGFTVQECVNGARALDAAPGFSPDLILCDVMMPEMDGVTTLLTLKQTPELSHIPVVFMSARVQKHEVEEYKQMGAVDVINKPFDPAGLPALLSQIWSRL